MDRLIDEVEFTIFDTETTGLEPRAGDRIVEIAAIRFKAGEKSASFESLVNPGRKISEAAFAVNHISQEMLEGAPTIAQIAPQFIKFIEGSCLCSYNAPFDLEFLNNELAMHSLALPQGTMIVDVLKMARRLVPGLQRYALWFVAEKMGVRQQQKHRALEDVEMTLGVFNKLREILKTKGVDDFKNFAGLFSIDPVFLNNMQNERLAQIQEAIDLGVKLKIKYLSSTSAQLTEREVLPKEIRQESGKTYLVGFCCLRNEERSFRIDGILHLEII
ncbi:MAG: WYL domain-containing protein [Candidatus Omnitrophica bacterium]|nr:WYL domain-containing protein [Candidatus Omnitrophota bacterium]